ncbi:PREDICTED: uncharacterized protein LOC106741088 isoform X2 [Dinoponera quadriceps]|uniref:Uncharacterized protein LOC106741088 isoform X2 n=1 Tax=Dinoponera quadriceps TaxID=609295 RepID=A0A6P3WR28_DINQU|nr:PREDICTED: uncharacterized protein LOC106741088 isoform X2 [Dinoponera quadriceps]
MFTPIKSAGIVVLNDTILNTPQPQASSTVQRKNTLENKYCSGDSSQEKHKRVPCGSQTDDTDDSSLGLLDNISVLTNVSVADEEQKLNYTNVNKELEYARKILQKCSNLRNSPVTIDMNKENDVNVQNITGILPASGFALSNKTYTPVQDQECNVNHLDKVNTTNITFEPNEISARSSGLSNSVGEQSLLNIPSDRINFHSMAEEFMAQFNKEFDEEFLSSSQAPAQLSIDEAHWRQSDSHSMPISNTTEKQELDCSAFSGIIGQVDLSIASCAGRKVSVGQYFKRKCNMGMLGNDDKLRPGFDVTSETPMKRGNLRPLIDSTLMADATKLSSMEPKEKEHEYVSNATVNAGENSILSLSTIASTLQDVNSETPRRLVDQLLMAQKKKKYSIIEEHKRETYTMPLERKSMLAASTENSNKFDDNMSLVNLTSKLSLDSRTTNEAIDKERISRMLSFASSKNIKEAESLESVCEVLKENTNDKNVTSSSNKDAAIISATDFKLLLQKSALSLSSNDKSNVFSCVPPTIGEKSCDEESYSDMNMQKIERKEATKAEASDNTMGTLFTENTKTGKQFDSNSDVIIGKNTEQLCNCIIGMTCKANIELVNKGDWWITCKLKLSEVRGDQQNITLSIPEDAILIQPNGVQSAKIEVKVTKMCKPIIAVLNIIMSDMVVKSKWFMTHMICFKPEELELDIICNSQGKQELDFQCIAENTAKVLPVIFHNKNNINVPVKLSILHEGPKIFSIEDTFNGIVKLNESHDELTHLVLKPQEKFTASIKCERSQLASIDCSPKQPRYWRSKLIICIQCGDGTMLLLKEIPLCAQTGICRIQVIDTEAPMIVSRQHGKLLNVVNSGNIATRVYATVVPIDGYLRAVQEFSIKPGDMSLQPEERGAFLIAYKSQIPDAKDVIEERCAKVKLVAGSSVYYYAVSAEQKPLEAESENYLRCDTPCNLVSTSSPTSPQSVTSSRSGTYQGRNSPSSVVSSVAVAGSAIPIRATHAALVWNSVKTSKSEIKEFTIRNTSNNKIKIQINICDDTKSFKFLGDRQTTSISMVLAMQRTESKTLAVMFNPYRVGPVAGKITIKHYAPAKEGRESQYRRIPLYGYGGCGKMKISDTFKDASGKIWLALGTLSSGTTALRANITLQNTGDLCTFAKIKVVPKVNSPKMDSSWRVSPTELILSPKESRQVSVEFYPKKEDFAILQHCVADVSHVATINIVYGDEPTRWRIRRLYNKIKESGELAGNENETFKNVVHPICKTFSGEQLISGLTLIRDPVQSLNDLCTGVQQYEIMLTVEACADDDTLPILHDNDDESQMYYSLISDNSHMDEVGGASFFSSQTMSEYEASHHDSREDHFTVNPPIVTLNPPVCNEATVTIFSFFKVPQPFQTNLSSPNYLSVVPAEGTLPSRTLFTLKIQCSQRIERNMQDVLEIYTENNKKDVLIQVSVKRQ